MKLEKWQQIKPGLVSALELEEHDRQAFLDKTYAGDQSLRQEVEAYLKAHDSAGDFLNAPILELLSRDMAEQQTTASPTTAVREGELAPGTLVDGRYLIERELGSGGFSTVFLAQDKRLPNQPVAIKVLSERLTTSQHREWVEKKFGKEAEIISRINHPGVIHPLDVGQLPDGRSYLVMPYISGPSLREVMSSKLIPLSRTARLIRQLADALTAVHDQGFVHRDVKPENVMLQTVGGAEHVKLIDFGIASVREELERTRSHQTKIVGTPCYMAPEQHDGNPCAASDIFSLGVIAYEMVACQRPFDPKAGNLIQQKRAGAITKPCELHPELPIAAQKVILRALAPNPIDRYQSAREFGEELTRALTSAPSPVGIATYLRDLIKGWNNKFSQLRPLQRKLVLSLASVFIVLCVMLAWLFFKEPSLPSEQWASRFEAARNRAHGITSGTAPQGIDSQLVGVTTWLFTKASITTAGTRTPLQVGNAHYIADRRPINALKQGDLVGFGIEVPSVDNSYVYVVSREVYADSSKGTPYLIFPGPTTPLRGNVTSAAKLLSVPALGDPVPWFTLSPSRPDQISEMLTIIISPKPLQFNYSVEELSADTKIFKLAPVEFTQLEKKWSLPVEDYKDPANSSQPWTRKEKDSSEGKSLLVSSDPLPQTIYRAKTDPGEPLLITVSLPVKP